MDATSELKNKYVLFLLFIKTYICYSLYKLNTVKQLALQLGSSQMHVVDNNTERDSHTWESQERLGFQRELGNRNKLNFLLFLIQNPAVQSWQRNEMSTWEARAQQSQTAVLRWSHRLQGSMLGSPCLSLLLYKSLNYLSLTLNYSRQNI